MPIYPECHVCQLIREIFFIFSALNIFMPLLYMEFNWYKLSYWFLYFNNFICVVRLFLHLLFGNFYNYLFKFEEVNQLQTTSKLTSENSETTYLLVYINFMVSTHFKGKKSVWTDCYRMEWDESLISATLPINTNKSNVSLDHDLTCKVIMSLAN